ncbi:phage holin family protein [Caenispirillum bisanense]|uniref:phage holin family protein n=1 Tax=Caenispirillum bisanense TaxID=414052 RepID=UPI0031DD3A23
MSHISMHDRSLGELVGTLGRDVVQLVRQEVQLARAEMDESVHKALGALITIGVGLAIAMAALVILLLAAVQGLSTVWQPWVASLVVGGTALVVAIVLAMSGRAALRSTRLAPRRTRDNLQQDREMLREHVR